MPIVQTQEDQEQQSTTEDRQPSSMHHVKDRHERGIDSSSDQVEPGSLVRVADLQWFIAFHVHESSNLILIKVPDSPIVGTR